jgi:hypothetical protein
MQEMKRKGKDGWKEKEAMNRLIVITFQCLTVNGSRDRWLIIRHFSSQRSLNLDDLLLYVPLG